MVKKLFLSGLFFVFMFLASGCVTVYTDGCCPGKQSDKCTKKEVIREVKKEVKKEAKKEAKKEVIREVSKEVKIEVKKEAKKEVKKGPCLIKRIDDWIKANLW